MENGYWMANGLFWVLIVADQADNGPGISVWALPWVYIGQLTQMTRAHSYNLFCNVFDDFVIQNANLMTGNTKLSFEEMDQTTAIPHKSPS